MKQIKLQTNIAISHSSRFCEILPSLGAKTWCFNVTDFMKNWFSQGTMLAQPYIPRTASSFSLDPSSTLAMDRLDPSSTSLGIDPSSTLDRLDPSSTSLDIDPSSTLAVHPNTVILNGRCVLFSRIRLINANVSSSSGGKSEMQKSGTIGSELPDAKNNPQVENRLEKMEEN